MNDLISTTNRVSMFLIGPSDIGKSYFFLSWLTIRTLQPKFDKIYLLYQYSQPFYDVLQKKNKSLKFVQCVNFELIDSFKNNSTKNCQAFTIHVKKFEYRKRLLLVFLLDDIVD